MALSGTTSSTPLAIHIAGMIVYNTVNTTDVTPGFYFNNGSKWIATKTKGSTAGDMQYWDGSKWVQYLLACPVRNYKSIVQEYPPGRLNCIIFPLIAATSTITCLVIWH